MTTPTGRESQILEGFPASPQQIFRWQQGLQQGAVHNSVTLLLTGSLDRPKLHQAVTQVTKRHDILRTQLIPPANRSTPIQVVAPEPHIHFNGDWQIDSLEDTYTETPIVEVDLHGPENGTYSLTFRLPLTHIDAQGLKVFVQEIFAAYASLPFERGDEDEPVQYAQYADWALENLEEADALKAFWIEQIRNCKPFEPSQPEGNSPPCHLSFTLPETVHCALVQRAADQGIEPSLLYQTAFFVFLAKRYGFGKTTMACSFQGRTFPELETAIGPYAKDLPMTLEFQSDDRFWDVAAKLGQLQQDYSERQDYYAAKQNLFFPTFEWVSPWDLPKLPALTLAATPPSCLQGTVPLKLILQEGADIQGRWVFHAELFDPWTRASFCRQFLAMLGDLSTSAHVTLEELSLLAPEDLHQLHDWAGSASTEPLVLPLALFDQQVAERPDAVALVSQATLLSYADLDRRTRKIARQIRAINPKPEQPVGLVLPRGETFVVGLLAAMRAGVAPFLIDPHWPEGRIRELVARHKIDLSITEKSHSTYTPVTVEINPAAWSEFEDDVQNAWPELQGEALAYLIFTSGSTGIPKGVGVTHANLGHYLRGIRSTLKLKPDLKWGHVSSPYADLGFTALFGSLLTGGGCHLLPQETVTEANQFASYMARWQIDGLKMTPSHLEVLLSANQPESALPRRTLVLGGETSSQQLWQKIRALAPNLALFNHYGPSETTIGTIVFPCQLDSIPATIPLGKPLPGNQTWIFNPSALPVPPETAGEILLGGGQVSRGYVDAPGLTAERFVPHPFGNGARLYKTGDKGHLDRHHQFHYAGRVDDQLKIRGFRVEPAEIVFWLRTHEAIADAVVLPHEDASGAQIMVAFAIIKNPAADRKHLTLTLATFLESRLPQAAIPQHFLFLDHFPLTTNGKIDRKALQADLRRSPQLLQQDAQESYRPPTTATQIMLVEAWQQTLGKETVGIGDHFFALGGHSLNGTVLMTRINEQFGIQLPLTVIFEFPVLESLALLIDQTRLKEAYQNGDRLFDGSTLPEPSRIAELSAESLAALVEQLPAKKGGGSISPQPRTGAAQDFPVSYAQLRLWILDQMNGLDATYNRPSALRIHGPLDAEAFRKTLAAILERHESLRTTFYRVNDDPVQRVTPFTENMGQKALKLIDLGHFGETTANQTAAQLVRQEALGLFDLKQGPLARFSLIRLGQHHHIALLTLHHIISDGWSIGVAVNELAMLYQAFIEHQSSPLPPLKIQYADFSVWQRNAVHTAALDQQLRYWKHHLADVPPLLALPTDRPRPPVQTYRGDLEHFRIDQTLSAKILKFCQTHSMTPFIFLESAYAALLSRYSHQHDILIGSPIANRTRGELEPLIGFFVNTLVLYTNLADNPSFNQLLRRTKTMALDAFQNQDIPFEQVVDALGIERNPSYSPLFQVSFALQNAPKGHLDLPGLRVSPFGMAGATAKFDLVLFVFGDENGFHGTMEFNTDLFEPRTVQQFLVHYQRFLGCVLEQPDLPVAEIDFLEEQESHNLIQSWNRTATSLPVDIHLPMLIAQSASKRPDAVGLWTAASASQPSDHLSWSCIQEQVARLSNFLRRKGLAREDIVAISLDRGNDLWVSQMAVLEAGGAFLCLDTSLPTQRLKAMVDQAQPKFLLTHSPNQEVCDLRNWCVLDWSDLLANASAESAFPDSLEIFPGQLAYLIFTSGSTGQPKGVAIHHRALVNMVLWHIDYYRLSPDIRASQIARFAFDASIAETWPYFAAGATLCTFAQETIQDPLELKHAIVKYQTHIGFVPTPVAEIILSEPWPETHALQTMLVAGSQLSRHPNPKLPFRICNNYGPTEVAVVTSCKDLSEPFDLKSAPPIGRPIANLQTYVLDGLARLSPLGVFGELYIGGLGLARGYIGQPGKTAERFVPNPYSTEPGARLYRTGDRVRWLASGELDFGGRHDHQVKIRGFRIELGEIEAQLSAHPEVACTAVLLHHLGKDLPKLVAYVEGRDIESFDEADSVVEELSHRQLDHWQALYEDVYSDLAKAEDYLLNFGGWNSSYTGEAIPVAEMAYWADTTAQRILALSPKRVLEIGCGSGLLLFRIAPHCEHYYGTDYSKEAIDFLGNILKSDQFASLDVSLAQRAAHELNDFPAQAFDVVVINSVVQYFPNRTYLDDVLQSAARLVRQGGYVFAGDLRYLEQLKGFHFQIQWEKFRTHPQRALQTLAQFRKAHSESIRRESELLISPAYFAQLSQNHSPFTHAAMMLKRGTFSNELTQFRYDVLLRVGQAPQEILPAKVLDWQEDRVTLERLKTQLKDASALPLLVTNIPNARLNLITQGQAALDHLNPGQSFTELEHQVTHRLDAAPGIHPEQLWSIAAETHRVAGVGWPAMESAGSLCALFHEQTQEPTLPGEGQVWFPLDISSFSPDQHVTNNPLGSAMVHMGPRLRSFLQDRLPDFMVPHEYIVLSNLPKTSSGKIDRRALPVLFTHQTSADFTPPQTPIQEQLAAIWSHFLELPAVGIHDDFFKLGGHSLMATKVLNRIREIWHVELKLQSLFTAPTIAQYAELLEGAVMPASHGIPLQRASYQGDPPASFAQQRLWFLQQLMGPNPVYNLSSAFWINGAMNRDHFFKSLAHIVARHDILRTTFRQEDSQVYQVVHSVASWPTSYASMSIEEGATRQDLQERIEVFRAQTFDLAKGPLFKVQLIQYSETASLLLVSMHHIVSDGWSLGVIVRELATCYQALSDGQPIPLPKLPIQYADYAIWQRKKLGAEGLVPQIAFWKDHLNGIPALHGWIPDFPRPARQTFHGDKVFFQVPQDLRQTFQTYADQQGTTLFMVLHTCFATLLHHYGCGKKVVLGVPVAHRDDALLEPLIGFLVNTLALCTNFDGAPTFSELVQQTKTHQVAAFTHKDVPFEYLVEMLQPNRSMAYSPLFQIMFMFQNFGSQTLDLPDLEFTPAGAKTVHAKFDLTLSLTDYGDHLAGSFEFNTALFRKETIEQAVRTFLHLSEKLVTHPELPVRHHALVAPSDFHQTYLAGSRREGATCLPQRLEKGQLTFASATALRWQGAQGEETLTYAALGILSDRLAQSLREYGFGRGDVLAIQATHSPELVIGLWAIVKLGAAFLPISPDTPPVRRSFMCAQGGAKLLLVDPLSYIPTEAFPVLVVERAALEAAKSGHPFQAEAAGPTDLAYLLFTSGSTGHPKGAAISHGGFMNYLDWAGSVYFGQGNHSASLHGSISFDATQTSLWLPFLHGGTLTLIAEDDRLHHLLGKTSQHPEFELVKVTPAHLKLLQQSQVPQALPEVRSLVLGGEALTPEHLNGWYTQLPNLRIFNEYGPTETVVGCIVHEVTPADSGKVIPIGTPIDNMQAYVLNDALHSVPKGCSGTLYLSGAGLAFGYWNEPALTALAFVPNPFCQARGDRLYNTGDRVRLNSLSQFEFHGRTDDMLKWRGYRIEPEEIATLLRSHCAVSEAWVGLFQDESQQAALTAFVQSTHPAPADLKRELVAILAQNLPDYMIPSHWEFLERFPLTAHGKIDRAALLQQVILFPTISRTSFSPTEELVAGIWQEVLPEGQDLQHHSNFFASGGHSLLATQVISRVERSLGLAIPISYLFSHPVLADFAALLDQATSQEKALAFPPLIAGQRTASLPLSFAQLRLWMMQQTLPDTTPFHLAFVIDISGFLDLTALQKSLSTIVERHEILRTAFVLQGENPTQIIHPHGSFPLPLIDVSGLQESPRIAVELTLLHMHEQLPFSMEQGYLLRAMVIRTHPQKFILAFCMHHIIIDGWSNALLVRELAALYQAFVQNRTSPLPALPIQYADFAVWQSQWLGTEPYEKLSAYWLQQLRDMPLVQPMPYGLKVAVGASQEAGREAFLFSGQLSDDLRQLSQTTGVTLFTLLLSGLGTTLHATTGETDIILGTDVANRNRLALEPLVGFFINQLVLRLNIGGSTSAPSLSFRQLLEKCNRVCLDAYAHQDMPFDRLVELLKPDRALATSPLFQRKFVLHNQARENLALPGLEMASRSANPAATKLDLQINMFEIQGKLGGQMVYKQALMGRATARKFLRHFETILSLIAADPDAPLDTLTSKLDLESPNTPPITGPAGAQRPFPKLPTFPAKPSLDP